MFLNSDNSVKPSSKKAKGKTSTMKQLIDIYHVSRSRGEWLHRSLEFRDGKDFMTFSVNSPAGTPAGTSATWNPGSTLTWHGRATPWNSKMRRKTPTQLRRNRKWREASIAKKCADADVKVENCVKPELEQVCSNPADVEDEIKLTEISDESANNECKFG